MRNLPKKAEWNGNNAASEKTFSQTSHKKTLLMLPLIMQYIIAWLILQEIIEPLRNAWRVEGGVDFVMKRYGNYGDREWSQVIPLCNAGKNFTWRISVASSPFAHDCPHISVEHNISLSWPWSWKNTLHGKLLNFTAAPRHSNV